MFASLFYIFMASLLALALVAAVMKVSHKLSNRLLETNSRKKSFYELMNS